MAAQLAPQSVLREFCPLYYLLNAIPAKVCTCRGVDDDDDDGVRDEAEGSPVSLQVQRGFRSVLVYLTALDSSSDFLAVGSSIGMLYLYCRRLAHLNKYSLEVRGLFLQYLDTKCWGGLCGLLSDRQWHTGDVR